MDSFSARVLDLDIEDARAKKELVDKKMDSIMRFMRLVELSEKDAQKAKQEVEDCSLKILREMEAQKCAKEANDKRARDLCAQSVHLAFNMKELLSRVSGVLDEGDGCLGAIDEMYKSLEKRLTLAVNEKEAAEREKLEKKAALAYRKNQMKKLLEESKRLDQQAIENLKMQEFLMDRRHVINVLKEEIACKCQDVNLLKQELEDYQDLESETSEEMIQRKDIDSYECDEISKEGVKERVIASKEEISCEHHDVNLLKEELKIYKDEEKISVSDDYTSPMIQDITPTQNSERYKWHDILKDDVKGRVEASKEQISSENQNVKLRKEKVKSYKNESKISVAKDYLHPIIQNMIPSWDQECYKQERMVHKREMKAKKVCKSLINNSKKKEMKKWIEEQIIEAVADLA